MEDSLILFAMPVFVLFIGVEFLYGRYTGNNTYRLNDTISSLSQGLLSQAVAVCTPFIQFGVYGLLYDWIARQYPLQFWDNWVGLPLAIVIYDFLDYWLHRTSHQCAFFWGAHVVHHQSQFFNLYTALRQESLYPIVGCFFFFPMALIGIPPKLFLEAGLFVLLYQFWIHTEHIGKLGWIDKILSTPSNHRVHHATNPEYIDKNFGAVLIIWDRLFGTFQEEQGRCTYGTSTPLNSWNPLWAVTSVYVNLFRQALKTSDWRNKCRVFFKNPGWVPPDLVTSDNLPTTPTHSIDHSPARQYGAVMLFFLAAVFLAYCLYFDEQFALPEKLLFLLVICGCLLTAGFFLESKFSHQD